MNYRIVALLIGLIILLYLWMTRTDSYESYESVSQQNVLADIPAFLTALEMYNVVYKDRCIALQTSDRLCTLYELTPPTTSAYKPPRLPGGGGFDAAVNAWNGTGDVPIPRPSDFVGNLPISEVLDTTKEFIYYAAAPENNMRFFNDITKNPALTKWEQWINNLVKMTVTGAGVVPVVYGAYLNVAGVKYKFTKMFASANTPIHALVVRSYSTNNSIGVAYSGKYNIGALRAIEGTVLENNEDVFELLINAVTQDDVNAKLDALIVVPVIASSSSAAPVPVTSSSAPPVTKGAVTELLDLPDITYYEDAWYRNRILFTKMYSLVPNPSEEVRRYYQSAGVGVEGQSYELTALKFLELDRLVLKSVTANDVVKTSLLQGPSGTYNLEVPYPYDPAMYDIMNTMEEPSKQPQSLKCYTLSDTQAKIIQYLSARRYEQLTLTNLELLGKYRANLCASYGYYSKDNVIDCKCEGCCIPVGYKKTYGQRTGGGNMVVKQREAEKILGSGDTGGCIYTSRAFRLKRQQLPLGVEEADVCVKEGFQVTRTFTDDLGAAKATAGVLKGMRMFEQRVAPAYLSGAGQLYSETDEGFAGGDTCLTPTLPSPYRLRRGRPKLMTCG
jgi:hypothetical protein